MVSGSDMIISGTVFNDILLWHVEGESPGQRLCCNRVSYRGHQVTQYWLCLVIFSAMINNLGGDILREGE
jgi:hypothetical protein